MPQPASDALETSSMPTSQARGLSARGSRRARAACPSPSLAHLGPSSAPTHSLAHAQTLPRGSAERPSILSKAAQNADSPPGGGVLDLSEVTAGALKDASPIGKRGAGSPGPSARAHTSVVTRARAIGPVYGAALASPLSPPTCVREHIGIGS